MKAPDPPRGSRGDGHGDGGQAARLRRTSDAVPFFSLVPLISRVSFNGSPHVVFSRCGCHVPALACRARGVPSGPRHVQSFNGRRARAQRRNQPDPSPRRGGTDGESKRGAASERHCDTSPRRGWSGGGSKVAPVKTNRAPLQRLTPQKQVNPPKGEIGWAPSPEPDGRQPKDWLIRYLRGTFVQRPALQVVGGRLLPVGGTWY